jgi:hypothetical protein
VVAESLFGPEFGRKLVYGGFEFVPFFKVSDAELVFPLPHIVPFFPEVKSY